ncbi:MAG: hypothetical protein KDD11_24020 [Acidobacteria bacterium]|nr:hypothetical protein [Acidobacteriota bacterium]
MAEALPSLAPMPFRMLIDQAMKETRRSLGTLWWPFALPMAVVMGGFGALIVGMQRLTIVAGQGDFEAAVWIFAMAFAMLLVIIPLIWIYCACFTAVMRYATGDHAPVRGSWAFSRRWPFIGTILLSGLCYLAGMVMCFFPAIWVALVLAFVLPVMVDEQVFGTAALKRSYALVRYNPQRRFLDNPMVKIFLFLVIGWVVSYVVSMVISLPFSIVQQVMFFRNATTGDPAAIANSGWLWLTVPQQVLGALTSMVVQIYVSFGLVLLFLDVRRRKEGQDLEEAVLDLERRHAPPAPETA